jgi:transcriptional regulator with XRE-family HTH domain
MVNTNVIGAAGVITLVKVNATNLTTLAGRLRHARARLGWTQQQLADAAGVTQGAIGNLESQSRHQPRDLLAIASALGVSAVWLDKGEGAMLTEYPALRGDVKDLAQLIEERLSEYQVAKIKEMVLAFGSASEEAPAPKPPKRK